MTYEELVAENKYLFKQLATQERCNMESRRALCERMDRLEAENRDLKAQLLAALDNA